MNKIAKKGRCSVVSSLPSQHSGDLFWVAFLLRFFELNLKTIDLEPIEDFYKKMAYKQVCKPLVKNGTSGAVCVYKHIPEPVSRNSSYLTHVIL